MRVDTELLIVGGGIAGATLAKNMAERGVDVLVVEREERFRDRVRGEALVPWGVTEARALGLGPVLEDGFSWELRYWTHYLGGLRYRQRDLVKETPAGTGCLTFYHPAMQEMLLQAAASSGASVMRGAVVSNVVQGEPPTAEVVTHRGRHEVRARLIVGADGRRSRVRRRVGFESRRDPERLRIAGVLLEGMCVPDDQVLDVLNPGICHHVIIFPQANGRARAYISLHKDVEPRLLSGDGRFRDFVEASIRTGADAAWYADAKIAGPLAMYSGAHEWVDHPYRKGVALIGDAAAASDPSWGQGLALALRDVRMLRDLLLGAEDWGAAASAYAQAHREQFERMHRFENWFQEIFMDPGPGAEDRLARCLPRFVEDISRVPECFDALGPDAPCDERARRRFFCE